MIWAAPHAGRRIRESLAKHYDEETGSARLQGLGGGSRTSGRSPRPCATMVSYRQVQVIDARSGASGVTMRGFGMFREFAGAVHGSTHTPASSMS